MTRWRLDDSFPTRMLPRIAPRRRSSERGLHDALGWTGAEIASAMEIGLPTAKQRLRRGRMMLVSALAEDNARRASLAQPMLCWRARRHVSAHLDGDLDEATKATVERHLESCPTCPPLSPLYASLVGIRDSLGGLRDPDTVVEDQIASRIHDQLALVRVRLSAGHRSDCVRGTCHVWTSGGEWYFVRRGSRRSGTSAARARSDGS
jgi:hypothetical protein